MTEIAPETATIASEYDFSPELTEDELFITMIRHLRRLQHQIDDIATQAAIELNKVRSSYNYHFDLYTPALRKYALEHAKVDKHGEKAKHYKSIPAGGGVFFRPIKEKITFDQKTLSALSENELTKPFICFEITYKALNPEKLQELGGGAEVTLGDPVGNMAIGTDRGWTPTHSLRLLRRALEGAAEEIKDDVDSSD